MRCCSRDGQFLIVADGHAVKALDLGFDHEATFYADDRVTAVASPRGDAVVALSADGAIHQLEVRRGYAAN